MFSNDNSVSGLILKALKRLRRNPLLNHCNRLYSVFLGRRLLSFIFSPLNARLSQPALFQRCYLSRVRDERGQSTPLTGLRRRGFSHRKKLFLKENKKL
jgi:hypothetical protein